MTAFPPDSPFFSRPEHTLPPAAHVTRPEPVAASDATPVPNARLEEWYRILNGYVDGNPYYLDPEIIEDLRDEMYSYLRG